MRRKQQRWIALALALCVLTVAAQTSPKSPGPAPAPAREPERRKFVRPNVPVARFTHEKTALLEPECERIASFLARYAAEKLTAGVLEGNAGAQTKGRLLLAVSLHLQPMNAAAVHCGLRWSDGQAPSLPPPADDLRIFSSFLLSAAKRQTGKPGPAPEALARILVRLAADLDPENEDAVYASEIHDRDGKAPPLRELLDGTLGKDW